MLTRTELADVIAKTFPVKSFRGEITLRQGRLLDDWNEDRALHEAAGDADETGDWDAISDADLRRYGSFFTYVDPAAVPFYLPALMCHCLRGHELQAAALDTLLFHFEGTCSPKHFLKKLAEEKFAELSLEQKAVVTSFLEFVAYFSHSEFDIARAQDALRGYWLQFKDWTLE